MLLAMMLAALWIDPVPQSFHGAWDLDQAQCADEDGLTRLAIDGEALSFYEWGGRITSTQVRPDGVAVIQLDWWDISEVDDNDQPIVSRREAILDMSADRKALELTLGTERHRYVRCEGAEL